MDSAETPSIHPAPLLIDIAVELRHADCEDDHCQEHHPNINTYSATIILLKDHSKAGHLKLHTLSKAAMETIGVTRMMQETEAYDEMHMGSQIHKVEIFFENESFVEGMDMLVADAAMIVFIEEVWLKEDARGKGRSLAAVQAALKLLRLPPQSVVILQAGSTDSSAYDPFEAEEKLTRHWAKLGFREWSNSDPSWLCLSTGDKMYGLIGLG